MAGSVQLKKGYWYTVIPVKDPDGKVHNKWQSTGLEERGNKRKAEQIMRDRIAEYERKQNSEEEIPFADFLKNWYDNIIRTQVKPNTYYQYGRVINESIIPFFKKLKVTVQALKPSHIQRYYDKRLSDGVSGATIKRAHANIHKCLNYAVKLELIPSNPASRVDLPRSDKFVGTAYTQEQIRLLLETVKGSVIEAPVFITLAFGTRRSETIGLKWSAIDLENNRLLINHTVVGNGKRVVLADNTKNNSSRRTLTYGDDMKQYFLSLKAHQEEMKKLLGGGYIDNEYVCRWDTGKRMAPEYVSRAFRRLLVQNDLPLIRFHDLRHSVASVLLNKGCDLKKISTWLGHCDIGTTANIYAHLQFESKVEMGNILNDVIFA